MAVDILPLVQLASSRFSEDEFLAAFDDCSLEPAYFHHADHIRLAYILLERDALIEALRIFTEGLKRFAIAKGATGLYNETITWAYMLLIHDRMQRKGAASFEQFREQNEDLFAWKPSILDTMYERETLISDLARKVYLLPDKRT